MNKFKWSILVLAIPLSGCFYQTTSNVDIRKAIQYCGGLDNLESVLSTSLGDEYAYCSNKESGFLGRVFVESK